MIPTIDIILVNWNAGILLSECINSINDAIQNSFLLNKVVIVDNASIDNSLDDLVSSNLPLVIIQNRKNVGFAKACNQGAYGSTSDFLLFLNPDTKLFDTSLSIPISFMVEKENEKVGIIGLKQINENNHINRNCASFPTPFKMIYLSFGLDKIMPRFFPGHFMNEWDHNESRTVDQVMGSFLFIRRSLFEELKGYDERYFVYFEDLDLALRAKKLGFVNYYLSTSQIYHKGGGTTENVKAKRLAYILNSKLLYCKKHFSLKAYYIIFIVTFIVEPFSRIIDCLVKGSPRDICEIIRGYRLLIKDKFLTNF